MLTEGAEGGETPSTTPPTSAIGPHMTAAARVKLVCKVGPTAAEGESVGLKGPHPKPLVPRDLPPSRRAEQSERGGLKSDNCT